jgi:hypothetical protein
MIIKATRTQVMVIETNSDMYPEGMTEAEMLDLDKKSAEDDPDMFFDGDLREDTITLEILK